MDFDIKKHRLLADHFVTFINTMAAKIIDGKALAKVVENEVREMTLDLIREKGIKPGLAVVLVGDRPDSATYVRSKTKKAQEVGFLSVDVHLPASATEEEVRLSRNLAYSGLRCVAFAKALSSDVFSISQILHAVQNLNSRPDVHGILVQLPLPKHVDEGKILSSILVEKVSMAAYFSTCTLDKLTWSRMLMDCLRKI